ncbi:hypothetical protein UPYG_G00297430 [Umbra pygmaea]|uniref:E2F transcription factor CC-MB domain-containing protein n=1 Tax=Umbra pygmaea TaxID=75934 RepID=A0ABD0WQP9_UMBPY
MLQSRALSLSLTLPPTYKYVTHEDICDAFTGNTLLAVVAPSGTQLEVPVPETGQSGQRRYQVNLRSTSAPIQVMLINRDSGSSRPVVFSVPPPEDVSVMPTPPTTPAGLQRFLPPYVQSPVPVTHHISDHKVALQRQHNEDILTSTPPEDHMECHPQFAAGPESQQPLIGTSVHPQQWILGGHSGQELQSMLDVSSLLKLSNAGDQIKEEKESERGECRGREMKEERGRTVKECGLPLEPNGRFGSWRVVLTDVFSVSLGVADLIDELMSSDVFPLLRLSPNAGVDYNFNLDDTEGVCDLFDVQILNY